MSRNRTQSYVAGFAAPHINLPCYGWCFPCLEECLLNHPCCATICGSLVYIPCMSLLFLLWLIQIPFTIIINIFIFIFCCNFCHWECCRGARFIADDDSVPNEYQGIVLHTAQSLRHLHVPEIVTDTNSYVRNPISSASTINEQKEEEKYDTPNALNIEIRAPSMSFSAEKNTISILQWNIFGQLGRYWQRYPLLTEIIRKLHPDIICLQEAITVDYSPFSTINTIKKINPYYKGFHSSIYDLLSDINKYKICVQYSLCWKWITEIQLCCNIYFLYAFWREKLWYWMLRSNTFVRYLFIAFIGIYFQYGNCILFKNNFTLFNEYLHLRPGYRLALRCLYIFKDDKNNVKNRKFSKESVASASDAKYSMSLSNTQSSKKLKNKRKKIWIVCTHLDAESELNFDVSSKSSLVVEDKERCVPYLQCKQMLQWMEKAQSKKCRADAIIICGDFHCTENSDVYKLMEINGYKSVVFEKFKGEKVTYPTETWMFPKTFDCGLLSTTANEKQMTCVDYVWIKKFGMCDLTMESVRLVGMGYEEFEFDGGKSGKLFASDHYGIFCKLSI